jgi:hypothetical protein
MYTETSVKLTAGRQRFVAEPKDITPEHSPDGEGCRVFDCYHVDEVKWT